MNVPKTFVTGAPINTIIGNKFANGCGGKVTNKPEGECIATYGIKRGSERAIKQAKEFWYIDHGYFGRSKDPHRMDGYYRIVHNALMYAGDLSTPREALKKFNIEPKLMSYNLGDKIILCPPSDPVARFFGHGSEAEWIDNTTKLLRQYTDRKILISTKRAAPLLSLLKDAWCVFGFNSNALLTSIIEGVPTISIYLERPFGNLDFIENKDRLEDFLYIDQAKLPSFVVNQWTIKEINSGKAWGDLNDMFNKKS